MKCPTNASRPALATTDGHLKSHGSCNSGRLCASICASFFCKFAPGSVVKAGRISTACWSVSPTFTSLPHFLFELKNGTHTVPSSTSPHHKPCSPTAPLNRAKPRSIAAALVNLADVANTTGLVDLPPRLKAPHMMRVSTTSPYSIGDAVPSRFEPSIVAASYFASLCGCALTIELLHRRGSGISTLRSWCVDRHRRANETACHWTDCL